MATLQLVSDKTKTHVQTYLTFDYTEVLQWYI